MSDASSSLLLLRGRPLLHPALFLGRGWSDLNLRGLLVGAILGPFWALGLRAAFTDWLLLTPMTRFRCSSGERCAGDI